MNNIFLFAAQVLIILVGVIALAAWLHRRLPAMWRSWVWGALSFVASQAVRIPLLLTLTLIFQQSSIIPRDADPNLVFWFNLLVLAGTAGLFEETARYVVLRWLAKESRGWKEAIMFGAGHGGIEAILIVGGAAVSNLFLLLNADSLLAQTRDLAPAQADALAAQIQVLRNVGAGDIALSLYERALAITLHIALSILVMRAADAIATELALTAVVVLLIALIIRPAPRVPSLQPNFGQRIFGTN